MEKTVMLEQLTLKQRINSIKTIEILNRSKQYVAKHYKINDENGAKEQKQQIKTIEKTKINGQRGENRRFELQAEAEKSSTRGANNEKKCHACDSIYIYM